jgi:hypothetical protein
MIIIAAFIALGFVCTLVMLGMCKAAARADARMHKQTIDGGPQ